jgi:hypothetical protein
LAIPRIPGDANQPAFPKVEAGDLPVGAETEFSLRSAFNDAREFYALSIRTPW